MLKHIHAAQFSQNKDKGTELEFKGPTHMWVEFARAAGDT